MQQLKEILSLKVIVEDSFEQQEFKHNSIKPRAIFVWEGKNFSDEEIIGSAEIILQITITTIHTILNTNNYTSAPESLIVIGQRWWHHCFLQSCFIPQLNLFHNCWTFLEPNLSQHWTDFSWMTLLSFLKLLCSIIELCLHHWSLFSLLSLWSCFETICIV